MIMKRTDKTAREQHMELLYGKENTKKPMYRTVFATHIETVRNCDYCGTPMTRSDVNDYGSLCERCYMREYYNE